MRFRNTPRGRLLGVIVATGLATSLTVTISGPAGAAEGGDSTESQTWAAPDWTYSPDEPILDGDIAARAIGESITHEEAERRLKADRAASQLQDVAQSRWPDTFAGLWISHDSSYRVNVAFTRDATARLSELRAAFRYPGDVQTVGAVYSLDALTALQGRLATERSTLQQGHDVPGMPDAIRSTRGVYDLDIDITAGQVVVRAAQPTSALRAAFAQRYSGPVVVREGLSKPRACTQADCRYAMLGGLQLQIGVGGYGGWCSSAFPAYYTSDPSIRYVLSAGHCYQNTGIAQRYNGGELYGSTTSSQMAYEVDVERDRRASGTVWRESSKFIVQGEAYPRMVNTVTTYASMPVGAYLGKTGYTTGTTRGYITSKFSAPSYVPNARNFVEADMCADGGDSGSAVWSGNSAYGILSGGYLFSYCRDINGTMRPFLDSAGTTIFGALSYATAAMAVTIMTGTNLTPSAEFTWSCFLFTCTFDASASHDYDGAITSYTWDFGDGTTGSGQTTTHSYSAVAANPPPGYYTVTLTTKDNNGATNSKSVNVSTSNSQGLGIGVSRDLLLESYGDAGA